MLRHAEAYDGINTAQILSRHTAMGATQTASPTIGSFGRRGTLGIRFSQSGGGINAGVKPLYRDVAASGNTAIVGFAFTHGGEGFGKLGTNASDDPNNAGNRYAGILYILQNGLTQVYFRVNPTGQIEARLGGSNALIGTSTTLTQDATSYLEYKVIIAPAGGGTVQISQDGFLILDVPSVTTRHASSSSSTWTGYAYGSLSWGVAGVVTWTYDDMYVADGSAGEVTDFLGDVCCDEVFPDANGTNRDFTPSTGTDDYAVVDEVPANDDTDFLESTVAGDIVTMGFPDAPQVGYTIFGVQVNAYGRKTVGGSSGHKPAFRIGGVNYFGAEVGLPSSFLCKSEMFEQNPDTVAPWTEAEFNGAEIGVQKSS